MDGYVEKYPKGQSACSLMPVLRRTVIYALRMWRCALRPVVPKCWCSTASPSASVALAY